MLSEDVFTEIVQQSRHQLTVMAYRLLRNEWDAEDAVQDGLVSAYRHRDTFCGRSHFRTWLTRVVMNAALMRIRKPASRRPHVDIANLKLKATSPSPEQQCFLSELRDAVDAVGCEATRMYLDGKTPTEIAEALGVRRNAVSQRMRRAQRTLRERLA